MIETVKNVKTFKKLPRSSEPEMTYFVEDENRYYANYEGQYVEVDRPEDNE